jgi:hypothetical protein
MIVALISLRYSLNYGVDLGRFEPAFDKWHLGIVRPIEFVCIAALLIRFQESLKMLAFRPLVIHGAGFSFLSFARTWLFASSDCS